jgi:hypothetical protein
LFGRSQALRRAQPNISLAWIARGVGELGFGAHSELKSDIVQGPGSAQYRTAVIPASPLSGTLLHIVH